MLEGERKAAVRGLGGRKRVAQRDKVQGALWPKQGKVPEALCPTLERCPVPSARSTKGARFPLPNARHNLPQSKRVRCARTEGPRSGSRQPIRSRGPREGRRPDERPGRGRRHLVVNSQVSDKAARSANGAGGFERTAFQDAFLSSPRDARPRKTGWFFKTLENISFCQTSAVPPSDSRPRAKPGLIRPP